MDALVKRAPWLGFELVISELTVDGTAVACWKDPTSRFDHVQNAPPHSSGPYLTADHQRAGPFPAELQCGRCASPVPEDRQGFM